MILTGLEIEREVLAGRVVITPFDTTHIEPNSYGFHLARQLICYQDAIVDAREKPVEYHITIPTSGYCLEPGRFYLGSTFETMGSDFYAATLYARRSTSTMGMWIQFSAPLGHTGAIIPWTLEITVIHPVIVYPEMPIGKIAFWRPQGATSIYDGKYAGSREVVSSRLFEEGGDDS
jgi:dCTP deaminase